MSHETMSRAVPAAIRKASELPTTTGEGWMVRIIAREGNRELRLTNQAQVALLTLELERLGFVLQVDDGTEADFVFEQCEMTAATG